MARLRLNIDGGISSFWFEATEAAIGQAQETDSAGPATSQNLKPIVTRMSLYGGVANNSRQFFGKTQTLRQAQETDTALAVIDPNDVVLGIGQAIEASSARSVSALQPAVITSCASSRGTDIVAASEVLQVNVNDSAGITAVTVNGTACTNVGIVTSTEVQCTVPLGVGAAPGATVDLVVNNGTQSTPLSVTFEPPLGMIYTTFTVDYAGLDPDSPFAGDTDFSDLAIGDVCIYDEFTTPDSNSVSMDGLGEFTIGGTIAAIQTFDYYIYDASDQTVSQTIEQITVYPGPVEVLIGQASEADTARPVSAEVVTTAIIGQATESDSALPTIDGSPIAFTVGIAVETDSALPVVAQGPIQQIVIGIASESNSAFTFTDGSVPTDTIAQALEAAQAFPVTDAGAVSQTISQATETNTALDVDFPADLNSIRDQIEALTDLVIAQQAKIDELHIRFDLEPTVPNTYADDASTIDNSQFSLTKTDNLDLTFTVTRTDNTDT